MSEKKRTRRRKDEYTGPGEQKVEKPSKEEYTIANWLKKNVKTKKTKFLSHNVQYFTSSKAIDALLKSKFAVGNNALFTTREQIIDFLDVMLEHKFFHRAKKVAITLDELRGKAEKAEKTEPKTETKTAGSKKSKEEKNATKAGSAAAAKESKKDTDNERKDTEAEAETGADAADAADSGNGNGTQGDKKEKRKRKIRLDMHPEQVFVDGSEAYVWIYDPIPWHYWIIGLILLMGAVAICLFPLWPPMLRQGVYYLSIVAAGFLVFILALTVVRLIVFTIVWILTLGKLHFWIFPNLTEDVGFLASFWPLYESKYVAEDCKPKPEKKVKPKSKKKDKNSDAEEEQANNENDDAENDAADDADETTPLEPEKIEEIKEHDAEIELRRRKVRDGGDHEYDVDNDTPNDAAIAATLESDIRDGESRPSESDSDGSSKDYEFINSSEVQNVN